MKKSTMIRYGQPAATSTNVVFHVLESMSGRDVTRNIFSNQTLALEIIIVQNIFLIQSQKHWYKHSRNISSKVGK
jgi:hypothetical protein